VNTFYVNSYSTTISKPEKLSKDDETSKFSETIKLIIPPIGDTKLKHTFNMYKFDKAKAEKVDESDKESKKEDEESKEDEKKYPSHQNNERFGYQLATRLPI